MEAKDFTPKKYTFAGREYLMKFPSYKRCQQIRQAFGDKFDSYLTGNELPDVDIYIKAVSIGYDGDWVGIDTDSLTSGQIAPLTEMLLDFFNLSAEMK